MLWERAGGYGFDMDPLSPGALGRRNLELFVGVYSGLGKDYPEIMNKRKGRRSDQFPKRVACML
jgi:hypothetical protein